MVAAVLIVLVTPALDELPCALRNHLPDRATASFSAATILPFLAVFLAPSRLYHANTCSQLLRVKDLLSSNCMLVC